MSPDTVIDLSQQALYLIAMITAPMLLSALAIGLIIGMFQAATQINEQTLSFLPRLLITLGTIMMAGPWLIAEFMDLFNRLITNIPPDPE